MKNAVKTLWTDDSGQAMSEYALIIAVIVVGFAVVIWAFRDKLQTFFGGVTFDAAEPS